MRRCEFIVENYTSKPTEIRVFWICKHKRLESNLQERRDVVDNVETSFEFLVKLRKHLFLIRMFHVRHGNLSFGKKSSVAKLPGAFVSEV